jgi:hypothetical protein
MRLKITQCDWAATVARKTPRPQQLALCKRGVALDKLNFLGREKIAEAKSQNSCAN